MKLTLRSFWLMSLTLVLALPAYSGYRVQNGRILNDANQTVQLRGVNWFGFETHDHVVHGLWARNWQSMIAQMKSTGFNAVRLPFCPATLQSSGVTTIDYSRNADLQNKNSLQILDLVVNEFNNQGMYVLLDHHRPDCNAISELWYTGGYSEQQWIADLVFVANRYKNLPSFIGLDLKNEPHGAATWSAANPSTDWNKAAERASAQILANAPNILIFVEGIASTAVCSDNTYGHFWGENLQPLACTPLNIPANRLVLSPHVYGPDVFDMPYFQGGDFPGNMPAIWDQHFGRFAAQGYTLVIGEFGGKYGRGNSRDRPWQDAFVTYLIGKNIRSSFYWSWNPNSSDTGGILDDDWTTIRQDKVQLLQRLWGSPATAATVTISGRVLTNQNRAVVGARIEIVESGGAIRYAISNPHGYYRFNQVPAGANVTLTARHKRLQFSAQTLNVTGDAADINFMALP